MTEGRWRNLWGPGAVVVQFDAWERPGSQIVGIGASVVPSTQMQPRGTEKAKKDKRKAEE